jgi:hypothetical protein
MLHSLSISCNIHDKSRDTFVMIPSGSLSYLRIIELTLQQMIGPNGNSLVQEGLNKVKKEEKGKKLSLIA